MVHFDKLVHGVLYLVLGALCARAIMKTRAASRGRAIVLAGVLSTAYGVTDELHQLLTPRRSCDALDVAADAAGAFVGAWLATMIIRRGKSAPAL